jgi:hypothetical protein
MVLVYSAFFLAMRAVERGGNAIVAQQRLRASREVLIRQLKSMSMHYVMGEGEERDTSMACLRGTSTALTFITSTAQGSGGGLARVVYRVLDDPPRLEMIEDPEIEGCGFDVSEHASEPVTLLDGFTSLRFQYQDSEGYGWKDEWDSFSEDPGGLPLAVQVQIEGIVGADLDVANQTLPIPAMVFAQDDALASEPDAACEFTPGCREAVEAAESDEEASSDDEPDDEADEDDEDDEKEEDD